MLWIAVGWMSRASGERFFRPPWLIVICSWNHGLQPWLHSAAANAA